MEPKSKEKFKYIYVICPVQSILRCKKKIENIKPKVPTNLSKDLRKI